MLLEKKLFIFKLKFERTEIMYRQPKDKINLVHENAH